MNQTAPLKLPEGYTPDKYFKDKYLFVLAGERQIEQHKEFIARSIAKPSP